MAYDDKGTKREVESLAKRFPKRGIDSTIPEGVREQLMDMRRQRELDEGMKAHEGRKLAKGGKLEERETQFHPAYMGLSDYEAIKEDEKLAKETGMRGSSGAAKQRLKRDSEVGRYANPEYGGDLGQFLKKGGKVGYAKGGSVRGDGICQRGHTKGKMR